MKYTTALFDFDGTLAHSDDALFHTFNETLDTHGFPTISRVEFNGYVGKSFLEIYAKRASSSDHVKKMRETHVSVQSKHFDKYRLFPHVLETLETLRAHHITMAIVTTANKPKILHLLKSMGIESYFAAVITAQDVQHVKPHPEPFTIALASIQKKPTETLMVGDSDADIEGAKASGIAVAAVTYSTFGEKVRDYHPDYVINDMIELIPLFTSTKV